MPLFRMVKMSGAVLRCSSSSLISQYKVQQMYKLRFISTELPKQKKALKTEKVRMYIVQRYIDYVKNYTSVLETRFPTAVKMYRVFSIGIKEFLKDLKTYITLRIKITKDRGFSEMKREHIELFHKMPSDMWRIAPVLILSAIPFGNYVIFPLAFLKPKMLLCSHFWSIQQRAEFSRQDLADRLKNNKAVFRALQAKLDAIPECDIKDKWRTVVALLGSGVHPTAEQILECKYLFEKDPYEIGHLTYAHMGYLLQMHGLRKNILRKKKLKYRAFILLEMDKAILREGGVERLSSDSLRTACLIRGLHSAHLTNQDMRDWLTQWLLVSQNVDKHSYSLILHCPVFFAYNHPQNWKLIY